MRILLVIDFFHLIFYAFYLTRYNKASLKKEKPFYIRAFGFKVYFKTIHSFLYLFNEIFCLEEYKVRTSIKTYVDLGANIGLSILWYYYFNPKMSIMAFEPDEKHCLFSKYVSVKYR